MFKKIVITNKEINKKKLNLKLRATFLLTISSFLFFSSFVLIVYIAGSHILRDINIDKNREMARLMASSVSAIVGNRVEALKKDANSQFVIDALKDNDLKYQSENENEIKRYLMDMDKRWIEAPSEHPFLKEYLENKLSNRLKGIKKEEAKVYSIVVTDRYGGLVASTNRPSGFFSFDQNWWQGAYANGEGKIYIGNVEYDEASGGWCLPFAVPIKDESGAVIGVYKAMLGLDMFFIPLCDFKLGATGKAVLVDDKAYLVYQYKVEPFANKFCEYSELKEALQNENKWGILNSAYDHHSKALVTYSEITYPLLVAKGINWMVFVEQNLKEAFVPLNKLILLMVVTAVVLIVIIGLSAFILSGEDLSGYSLTQVIKQTSPEKTTEKEESDIKNKHRSSHFLDGDGQQGA